MSIVERGYFFPALTEMAKPHIKTFLFTTVICRVN